MVIELAEHKGKVRLLVNRKTVGSIQSTGDAEEDLKALLKVAYDAGFRSKRSNRDR